MENFTTSAEPLIRSIWTGSFQIHDNSFMYKPMNNLSAFMSNKACQKVHDEAVLFKPVLNFEMVPKSFIWPKSFMESGPHDRHIGLYIFPSLLDEKVYNELVLSMVRDDLAMKTFVDNAELLVFTSMDLPPESRRFQGSVYLWGVLRRKTAPPNYLMNPICQPNVCE